LLALIFTISLGTSPGTQLFSVQVVDEYFTDIIEYLSTGVAPQEFSTAQKKNMVVRVADYQLIAGHLYKMGAQITF
jgi:hypothetical protein